MGEGPATWELSKMGEAEPVGGRGKRPHLKCGHGLRGGEMEKVSGMRDGRGRTNCISGSLGAVGTHIFRVAIMQGSIYAAVLLPGCAIARVGCFQACF